MKRSFFHMSGALFSVGDAISANGKDKVDQHIENELENKRPTDALCRRDAVFCLETTDFSVCGVTKQAVSIGSSRRVNRRSMILSGSAKCRRRF